MPKVIRPRPAPPSRWSSLLAGAALGAAASWLVTRRRTASDPGERVARAWDETLQGLASARERMRARRAPDLDALRARVRASAGAERLEVRSLGSGIVEVVGTASEDLELDPLLDRLSAEDGVCVVVNRIWTPRSARPTGSATEPPSGRAPDDTAPPATA